MMIREQFSEKREPRTEVLEAGLVVVGGGLAGVCTAITAARVGVNVILVQDRPMLGGNASSEIRLWILGATSHMGNNNRWAREGGMVDEILVENMWRNPEGNPVIFDTILLEKVLQEKNIRLLLNTTVYDVEKSAAEVISKVIGFCSQNSTKYILSAPFFCDASGDGIVAFQAGAAFRMGAETADEFGELFAPTEEYGALLGHSLYFYSKDTGVPVKFVAPSYALEHITDIPRYRRLNAREYGCQLWWIEYGGRLDTVHDTEKIKWELWKVIYGVWDYIKNSGEFPEAETLTLEWVGMIPGKRESRRFEGDYMLSQQDIVHQRTHDDAVAFGGWSIDLHPADGVFSEKPGCNQWHGKGIYQIPYRCLYSRNLDNLFLAGRIISASHVAFGSSRVMATAAYVGQASGMAAALCLQHKLKPRDLLERDYMQQLQTALLRAGQHIPGLALYDEQDLVQHATINTSSEYVLRDLPPDDSYISLSDASGQMLPLPAGPVPEITVCAQSSEDTWLEVELRVTSTVSHHTPDVILETLRLPLQKGLQEVTLVFKTELSHAGYVFICFMNNEEVSLQASGLRVTGILSVFNKTNPAVSNYGKQEPPENIGMHTFEFWCPERRPAGKNIAMQLSKGIALFGADNIRNGIDRPVTQPNAWLADPSDPTPAIAFNWEQSQRIREVVLTFDTDLDHPMESVLMGHPERVMPFCVKAFALYDEDGNVLHEEADNHQTRRVIKFDAPVHTRKLTLRIKQMHGDVPPGLFGVRCYV